MPRHRWVVDQEHPSGHAVPLTPVEEAALDADQTALAAAATVQAGRLANQQSVRASITARMAQIRTARTALTNGNIFSALSVNEKAVIDGLLEDDLYLARLTLDLYEGTA